MSLFSFPYQALQAMAEAVAVRDNLAVPSLVLGTQSSPSACKRQLILTAKRAALALLWEPDGYPEGEDAMASIPICRSTYLSGPIFEDATEQPLLSAEIVKTQSFVSLFGRFCCLAYLPGNYPLIYFFLPCRKAFRNQHSEPYRLHLLRAWLLSPAYKKTG